MITLTLMSTNTKTTEHHLPSWALVCSVLVASLVFLLVLVYPSYSNAQDVGPNGGTIVSEETTVESLGGGLEVHTTTTVEEVTSESTSTVTSKNYLSNPGFEASTNTTTAPNWSTSGSTFIGDTCGPGGGNCLETGNQSTGGGTAKQTVDLFNQMTKSEINQGFDITYGAHVHSDSSNLQVPLCSSTSYQSDCKDMFSITLDIKDSAGNLLHKFEHVFDNINFSGYNKTDFFFTQTIQSNEYDSALATLELFGIDQGFYSGNHGPKFDNSIIQTTFDQTQLIVSQITTITEELVATAIDTLTDDTTTSTETLDLGEPTIESVETEMEVAPLEVYEVQVADNMGGMESFEVTVDANMEITVEPIADMNDTGTAETVSETVESVEAEVETQVAEVTENVSDSPEPDSSGSDESTEDTAESGTSEPKSESKSESKAEGKSESKSKSEPKTKAEAKREMAQKIVQNIVARLGNSAQDQATQVALMNLVSADITANQPKLIDNTSWYQSTTVYNNQSITNNNAAQYYMFGGSDAAMNSLVSSQYK